MTAQPQPQPGQWWRARDGEIRKVIHRATLNYPFVLIAVNSFGMVTKHRLDGQAACELLDLVEHLPDCDSFDWQPPKPDPGEGWRLIDKAVDVPQDGDEIWHTEGCEWQPRLRVFRETSFSKSATYRRRIEPPKPRTRTVVLREWLLWSSSGHECLQGLASDPLGWPHRYPTGETRTIEIPE